MRKEDIEEMLKPGDEFLQVTENINKSIIRINLDTGKIDPELLTKELLTYFILYGFESNIYDMAVQEKTMEKVKKIDSLLINNVFFNEGETYDKELAFHEINRSTIRDSLENGYIDYAIVTEELINDGLANGFDYTAYNELVKKWCEEKQIDIDEYKKIRDAIFKERREKNNVKTGETIDRDNKIKELEGNIRKKLGYDYLADLKAQYQSTEDYYDHLIEAYGDDYLSVIDIEIPPNEFDDFIQKAADEAELPENINIKNNWMNRIKDWIKDKVNSIKNTFQR